MANERSKTPTLKTHGDAPRAKAASPFQTEATKHEGPLARRRSAADPGDDDPTHIFDSGTFPTTPKASEARSINMVSKKTPGVVSSGELPLPPDARAVPKVKLRAISEVARSHTPQQQLGYLAPPRDPAEVRARRRRDFVVWGSICVILACGIALGIWFIAN